MNTPNLDVIDVGGADPLDLGGAHDSWYSHPWVSLDTLALLLFNLAPLKRGLTAYRYEDIVDFYRFPEDYFGRIIKVAEKNVDLLDKKHQRVNIIHYSL